MPRLVLLAALTLAVLAPTASAATSLKTYEATVDVDLALTLKSDWKGIRAGCFAPAENFSVDYGIVARTRRISRVRPSVVSMAGANYGSTPTYGADGGFRQFMNSGPWELQTQYPPGCNSGTAPAPPSWAVAPLCNRIEEKVSASLVQSGDKPGAGSLVLLRTPAARPAQGASIGARCLRTFHNIVTRGLESDIALTLKGTAISIPIPNLKAKLAKLAKGKRGARPSFSETIDIGGDCTAVSVKPSIGERRGFVKAPFSTPARALGSPADPATGSVCMVSGDGKLVVTRVGPAVNTAIPAIPKIPGVTP